MPQPNATAEKSALQAQAQGEAQIAQAHQDAEQAKDSPYNLIVACRDDACVTLLVKGVPVHDQKGVPTGQYLAAGKSFLNGQRVLSTDLHPSLLALFENDEETTRQTLYKEGETPPEIYQGPNVEPDGGHNPQVDQAERTRAARQSQGGR
jgi:hypothetical protein